MTKEKISLQEFINKCGSKEAAANALNTSYANLYKWIKGKSIPNISSRKNIAKKNIKQWWVYK